MSRTFQQRSGSPNITINQNNVIVLEINNLLNNWPTYVLNYTPEQPGPLKIILRLKDVRKCAIDDDDETSTIGSDSDLEDMSGVVTKQHWQVKGASIALQLSSSGDENSEEDSGEDNKTLAVDATPVFFHGILKDKIPVKPKFFDSDSETIWPPIRPRTLRPIPSNDPVSQYMFLRTFPAPVKVIDDKQDY